MIIFKGGDIRKTLLILFLSVFYSQPELDNFTYMGNFNEHEYYISNSGGNYIDGIQICENLGGYLVTITSQEENDFVLNALREYGGDSNHLWLGLDDLDGDGVYTWITGETVDYTNWSVEPSIGNAVEMATPHGGWNSINPSETSNYRRYMLEIPDCDLGDIDECGVCYGDNSSCLDCLGVPNGESFLDNCGVCDSDTTNDCTQDCDGNWGGNLVYDNCGVCDGDNTSCSSLQISNVNITTGVIDITLIAVDLIAGFQFDLSGINIMDAFGGVAEENDFEVENSSTTIIGFSMTGSTLPIGEYILTQISFEDYNVGEEICFEGDPIFSGSGGVSLNVVSGECVMPIDLGDVNADGNIDVIDIVMIVGFILNNSDLSDQQMVIADISGDGSLDVIDVVMLVGFILNP